MTETSSCPRHPDTPTKLRCSKCGTLVCPQCLVYAPVGIRCQDCGQPTRLPTYDVPASFQARAIAASLLLGLVGGLILTAVARPLGLFVYLAAMAGFGYLLGESVSWSAGRKRGRALQVVAGGGVLAALATIVLVIPTFGGSVDVFDLLGAGIATYVAAKRLR